MNEVVPPANHSCTILHADGPTTIELKELFLGYESMYGQYLLCIEGCAFIDDGCNIPGDSDISQPLSNCYCVHGDFSVYMLQVIMASVISVMWLV